MRKLATVGLAVMTAIALAAVAFAQTAPTITGELQVTPVKAGTKAKPANGRVVQVFNVNPESKSTLRRIEYTIPKNVKLNGKGFETCSSDQVNLQGENSCPAKSQVGTGAATAELPDGRALDFDVKVFVAGAKELTLSLVGITNIAFPATISGQVVAFDIPSSVQQPAPGLYTYVTSVTADLGKQPGIKATTKVKKTVKVKKNGKTKKVKKNVTVPFASVVGCSGGKHDGSVKAFLAPNPNPPTQESISVDVSAPCS